MLGLASNILPPGLLTNQLEFFFAFYFICIGLWFVIAILLCVWVYRDAQSRGMSGALWLVIVLIAGLLGLIIYFVVRSPKQAPPMAPYGAPAPPPAYGAPPPAYGAPPPAYAPPPAPPQQMATNCRYCGAPLPPGAVVCPRCGGRL